MNRKDFFRKVGLGVGALVATKINHVYGNFETTDELNNDQKLFLKEYKMWLTEFHEFVEKRSENEMNMANNSRLMELSAQADKRKPLLEKHMKDAAFANYFNAITSEISQKIV